MSVPRDRLAHRMWLTGNTCGTTLWYETPVTIKHPNLTIKHPNVTFDLQVCGPSSPCCEVILVNLNVVRGLHLVSTIDVNHARNSPSDARACAWPGSHGDSSQENSSDFTPREGVLLLPDGEHPSTRF